MPCTDCIKVDELLVELADYKNDYADVPHVGNYIAVILTAFGSQRWCTEVTLWVNNRLHVTKNR
ncbi:MAG: hypothetical protein ACXV5I_08485 [Halobacteriota archaeon]